MSLVNDALKRATEAQKNLAPTSAPGMVLRPVEPAQHKRDGPTLVVPATLLTIGAAAILSLILLRQDEQPLPAPAPTRARIFTTQPFVSTPTLVGPSSPGPPLAPAVPEKVAAAAVVPDPPPPAPLAAPQPAPLRLQAVFFTPGHPSAIISAQTVFVGDTVRGLKVVAIGAASALLVNASHTNLLTLE